MLKSLFAILFAVTLITACGGGNEGSDETPMNETTEQTSEQTSGATELTIAGNDQMKFDKETLTVKAGATVKLTLKHSGNMPVETMGHNWVLLANGVDIATFATKAIEAGIDNNYVPTDAGSQVIAHTKVIGGGQETTIEFTAPAAGSYDFICTFPGHWSMMKGKLIVE